MSEFGSEVARLLDDRGMSLRQAARLRRIAISGHRGLPGPTTDLVDKAIRAALAEHV